MNAVPIALSALLLAACVAPDPRPWHCPSGELPDPYCVAPAARECLVFPEGCRCTTDTECAQLCGGNGDPDPADLDRIEDSIAQAIDDQDAQP